MCVACWSLTQPNRGFSVVPLCSFFFFFPTRAEISKQNVGAFELQITSVRINKELVLHKHQVLFKDKKQQCQSLQYKTAEPAAQNLNYVCFTGNKRKMTLQRGSTSSVQVDLLETRIIKNKKKKILVQTLLPCFASGRCGRAVYTYNMWQLTASIMSKELKPHMNDFLDISWFFMDTLLLAQH